MARILVDGEWFEQVEPSTFSESFFEDWIVLHAPSVYPEYFVLPFKKTVESDYGTVKPDLIFISKDYEDWRIVEIEMGYHSLGTHVEPQVQKLANASYGVPEAEYLCSKQSLLNFKKVVQLLEEAQPAVLVLVNEPRLDWGKSLSKYGARVVVFEMFRSERNKEIFRVDGEYPTRYIDTISECFFHPFIARLLEIRNPEALALPLRGILKLRYNNCITEWERVDAEGKVWLCPLGRNPLITCCQYVIVRQSDSSFTLLRS